LIGFHEKVPATRLAKLRLAAKRGHREKASIMKLAVGLVTLALAATPIAVAPSAAAGNGSTCPEALEIARITGAPAPAECGGSNPAGSPATPPPAAPPAPAPVLEVPAAPPPAVPAPPAPVVAPPTPAAPAHGGISPGHGEPANCGTPEQPPGTDSLCPVTALTPFN
jgi:hypothetical protein